MKDPSDAIDTNSLLHYGDLPLPDHLTPLNLYHSRLFDPNKNLPLPDPLTLLNLYHNALFDL